MTEGRILASREARRPKEPGPLGSLPERSLELPALVLSALKKSVVGTAVAKTYGFHRYSEGEGRGFGFRSVVVITFASHAKGPRFEAGRKQPTPSLFTYYLFTFPPFPRNLHSIQKSERG